MSPALAIFSGTLIVGSLDLTYAIVFWFLRRGLPPTRILQSVAAGLLGRDGARNGGMSSALLGLVLHYFIAFAIVFVYWIVSRRVPILTTRPWLFGAIYGLGVYAFMNYVVIPLSAIGRSTAPPYWPWIACSLFVHAFFIGVPAALVARNSAGAQPSYS